MVKPVIFIVCGPTAAGKTAFAIRLANLLHTEIISADSRQCFKELNIGVAKPSDEELASVHHYFINSHSIQDDVNAVVFEQYALQSAKQIFAHHSQAIMVGGTGLYIKAFCEGMDDIPVGDPFIRQRLAEEYEKSGLEKLQKQVAEKDPEFWRIAEQQNPQRLMRALEIYLSTGKSVTSYRNGSKAQRPFHIVKLGLTLPRELLYQRINARVDKMIEQGLAEEAFQLLPQRTVNALQTVGYRELFDYFDGKISLDRAVTDIKTNTRHYAKRQLTWFRKDTAIAWHNADDEKAIEKVMEDVLSFKQNH